jgi:hypothetical protein
MKRPQSGGAVLLLGLLPLSTLAGSAVNTSDLARCAAIAGADQRLACYDTLARRALPAPAVPAAAPATAPAAAPTAAPLVASSAAASAPANPAPANFGMSRHEQTAPDQPQAVRARVTQITTDRQYNVHLTLDNGQVWTFNASDSPLRAGDTVTIKRSALGSYLLSTADHHSWHAQRLQ